MTLSVRRNWTGAIATLLLILGCGAGIIAMQLPQLNRLKVTQAEISPQQAQREVELETKRLALLKVLPAFGFDNLLANWTFINFLTYFGDDPARLSTGFTLSPEYFEIIINRDPRFVQSYLFLSTSVSLFAGLPERSVALMRQGLNSLSPQVPAKSYYAWRYKGIDELLFLGDAIAASQSFEKAAAWASLYADPESQSVAHLSQLTAQSLAQNPDSKFAQIAVWSMVLSNAPDERTRQRAIINVVGLGGQVVRNADGFYQVVPPARD